MSGKKQYIKIRLFEEINWFFPDFLNMLFEND